jgi:S1-C subfamily serine protease
MTNPLLGRAIIISMLTLIVCSISVGGRVCAQSSREFSLYQNLDLVGDDIQPWLRNYTLEGCKRACASNSQCQAFTFNVKQSVCIQKHGYGQPNVNADAISGATRAIVGVDYEGGDLDNGQRGISAGQCFTLCSSNPKCVGFAYVQAKNWCWQKAQLMPPVVKADVMSWTKAALDHPPAIPPTTSDGTTREPQTNRIRYGTGFFVTPKGHVLTNFHVIKDCKNITISFESTDMTNPIARLVASDPTNDLAVLATRLTPSVVPAFNSQVRTGDSIFVYGFPLAGLLASSGNFTTGSITAKAGLGDNTSFFQISAPVQPGNSGGPLIDEFGNVAGVITSKLNVLAVANVTNDIAQNINFAIKPGVAVTFLESYGLSPVYGIGKERLEPANIAELAKQYTVRVSCQ